ncbi:MAG: hypothetical protein AB1644_13195 [Candidatus Zixiibacteriota bacterium]
MNTRIFVLLTAAMLLVMPAIAIGQNECPMGVPSGNSSHHQSMCDIPMLLALADEEPLPEPGEGAQTQVKRRMRGDFEQRRKHLEQLRLLKLLELLDLREDQESRFVESFRGLRRDMRAIERERAQTVRELSQEVKAHTVDARKIDAVTAKLVDLEGKHREARQQFLNQMKQVLDPDQLAKFILFQERFELELLERVREFRERMGPMGNPGGDNSDS